jgi:DNA-binding transcriptional LysR family regulator
MKTLDPLNGLAAFLAVADAASFSKAADALGMSRATVGAQVQALEKRLGIRLLRRTTRSVALTEAGAAYRQALAGVLPQVREAERAAGAFQTEAVGRLRISAPPDLGPDHVVPVVAAYLAANPAVTIDLDLSMDAVKLVEDGFDLAVRGTITLEPNLVTRQVGTSPIVVCASPGYLERHGVPQHPEALAGHACLHFSKLSWGRVWRFRRDEASLHVPILPRLEVNDGRSLLHAALADAGIALEPSFVVGPAIRAGRLIPILTDWKLASVPVHAVYPDNRHVARKVRSFVAMLARSFADHPDLREAGVTETLRA